jgi:hypothetical protein
MTKIEDFALFIFEIVRPIYSSHWEIARETDDKFEDIGTEKEKYLKKLFVYFTTIQESVEKLIHVKTYLSIENVPKHYTDNEIEEIEYYRYHIENFHIKCVSNIDYTTLLLNHSLKIGIPNRKCGVYSITENTNFIGSDLSAKLKAFDTEFQEMKSGRNKIVHQGNFESKELSEIDSNIFSPLITEIMGENLIKHVSEGKAKKVSETIQKFEKQILRIQFHIGEILEELTPYIKRQIKIYELAE